MKSKKPSPWVGAGVGCLAGVIFSVCAIATIQIAAPIIATSIEMTDSRTDLTWVGKLIQIISYLPLVTAIVGYIIYKNRQTQYEIEARQNPPDLEEKVLELLGKGLSNSEIAEKLGISVVQISLIKTQLIKRFNLNSETELIEEASRRGYLPVVAVQDKENSQSSKEG